jgi:formylglycine-generating enzyme required for sulfatase activity
VLAVALVAIACGSRTELLGASADFGGSAGRESLPEETPPPSTPPRSENGCPGGSGPSMVLLPEAYCIDSTEVTRAQYRTWLETNTSLGGQVGVCENHSSFTPDPACMRMASCQNDCDQHPQVCVDWCDADAYCRAAGRRLCGKIGGGRYPSEEIYYWTRADLSEWFNACSAHDTQKYANGKTYTLGTCNGPELGRGTFPVGSLSTCQSPSPGYAGVFDLSGNVSEWEALGEAGHARLRGGNYAVSSMNEGLSCAVDNAGGRLDEVTWFTGFRCCATP